MVDRVSGLDSRDAAGSAAPAGRTRADLKRGAAELSTQGPGPARGPSARAYLLILLGDYALDQEDAAWTHTVVEALSLVGFEEKAARQALTRTANAGMLSPRRVGRRTRWHLTPAGHDALTAAKNRLFATGPEADWTGEWLIVLATVPESHRNLRHRLRTSMSWAGFGSPGPGLWVSPHPSHAGEARQVLNSLGDTVQGTLLHARLRQPRRPRAPRHPGLGRGRPRPPVQGVPRSFHPFETGCARTSPCRADPPRLPMAPASPGRSRPATEPAASTLERRAGPAPPARASPPLAEDGPHVVAGPRTGPGCGLNWKADPAPLDRGARVGAGPAGWLRYLSGDGAGGAVEGERGGFGGVAGVGGLEADAGGRAGGDDAVVADVPGGHLARGRRVGGVPARGDGLAAGQGEDQGPAVDRASCRCS